MDKTVNQWITEFATQEGIKEAARSAVIFLASATLSWFVAETLKQIGAVPEFLHLKLWVFVYAIPVRSLFTFFLFTVSKGIERAFYKYGKDTGEMNAISKVLTFSKD